MAKFVILLTKWMVPNHTTFSPSIYYYYPIMNIVSHNLSHKLIYIEHWNRNLLWYPTTWHNEHSDSPQPPLGNPWHFDTTLWAYQRTNTWDSGITNDRNIFMGSGDSDKMIQEGIFTQYFLGPNSLSLLMTIRESDWLVHYIPKTLGLKKGQLYFSPQNSGMSFLTVQFTTKTLSTSLLMGIHLTFCKELYYLSIWVYTLYALTT